MENSSQIGNDTSKFLLVKRIKKSIKTIEFFFYKSSSFKINKIILDVVKQDSMYSSESDDPNYYCGKVVYDLVSEVGYFYDNLDHLFGKIFGYLKDKSNNKILLYNNCYNYGGKDYPSKVSLVCKLNWFNLNDLIIGNQFTKNSKDFTIICGDVLKNILNSIIYENDKRSSKKGVVLKEIFNDNEVCKCINNLFSYSFLHNNTLNKISKSMKLLGKNMFNINFYNNSFLDSGEKWNDNCAICLEPILDEKGKYCKLPCSHVYHIGCLEDYSYSLSLNNRVQEECLFDSFTNEISCPCCKQDIKFIKDSGLYKSKTPNFSESLGKFTLNFSPIIQGMESKKNIHIKNLFGKNIFKMMKIKKDLFSVMINDELDNKNSFEEGGFKKFPDRISMILSTINLIT